MKTQNSFPRVRDSVVTFNVLTTFNLITILATIATSKVLKYNTKTLT